MPSRHVNTRDSILPTPSLLDSIRHQEAEVKRHLAAERLAAQTALTQAEQRARELVAAADAEGQHEGAAQRQLAQHEAENTSKAMVAQARLEAERLRRQGEAQLDAAITRAIEIVLGGAHAT